ncbi:MAG: Na+/H+ antiporter NhaA [Bacteroidales bacterium]|jgi:NhaA family Na+:H+ antiporter|nr:Na+/H+ antiporter NhaA [Bacteroidales bacterium]
MEVKYRNKNFYKVYGFIEDFKTAINPGTLLMIVALLTMIVANSPLKEWYESIWQLDFFLGVGKFNLLSHHGHALNLLHVINDGIMTVFFFAVGLEIKREVLVGELSSLRQAMLPIIAAFGGMIVPVLVFFATGSMQNFSPEEMKGMAIPMATDIAFSIGILSLLGKRVPLSLKIFLLALAIVDDIGGILVIAIFYSNFSMESFIDLGIALLFFGILIAGNRLRVNNKLFYFINGLAIWFLFLQAGIHPTISGVLVAFTVPARPQLDLKRFTSGLKHDIEVLETTIKEQDGEDIVLSNNQVHYLGRIEAAADHVISPLQDMEDNLHDVVNYIIMPLFAFANAGVVFNASSLNLFEGVSLSIFLGLVLGKMVGIFSFTWLAIKLRVAHIPSGMKWSSLGGLSMLGGVGFTVALFLAGLSYPAGSELLNGAKMGIIAGSVAAGLGGYFWLKVSLKDKAS